MRATTTTGCLLLVVGLAGCGGGSDRSPTVQIAGTVMYDGKPLASGNIVFESSTARPAQGRIVDGNLVELMT